MARIVTGPVVADIAGKVGDNIFSRNKYGPYVKAYASPTIPGSTYVTAARAAMTAANLAWSNLSDSEKLNYASFSTNYPINSFHNGYQKLDPRAFFVANYINQVFAGVTPNPQIVNPPSFDFSDLEISIPDCNNLNFKTNGGSSGSTFKTSYYAYNPVNLNILSFNTIPQYAFSNGNYVANSDVNLKADYLTRWPALYPEPTERVFGSVRIIHAASGICVGESWNKAIGTANYAYTIYGNSGTLSSTVSSAVQKAARVTIPAAGWVTEITFDVGLISQNLRFALYDDDSGKPGTLLAATPIAAQVPIINENTITFTTPYYISTPGDYWVICAASVNVSLYNTLTGGFGSFTTKSGTDFNTTWIESSSNTRKIFGRLELKTISSLCGTTTFTLGNQTIYGSTSATLARLATKVTPAFDGFINSITFYHDNSSGNCLVGVYSSAADIPIIRLSVSPSTPLSGVAGWQTVNLPSPLAVTGGTDYFIAYVVDSPAGIPFQAGGSIRSYNTTGGMILPSPFNRNGNDTTSMSVYCEGTYN